jgi:hypothetical protein
MLKYAIKGLSGAHLPSLMTETASLKFEVSSERKQLQL